MCHAALALHPLMSDSTETQNRDETEKGNLSFPESSLSSCPSNPTNQGCMIARQAFLISSPLVGLASVCLSGATSYSDLSFVCYSFLSALAWLSCSVVVPVVPSCGGPGTLNVSFPHASQSSWVSYLLCCILVTAAPLVSCICVLVNQENPCL